MEAKTYKMVSDHVNREGACGFGVKEAKSAKNVSDLINLMLTPKGIEHCMKRQWPLVEDMKPYREELLAKNVIIDGNHTLRNPRLVIAFGGVSTIHVDSYNVCEIYATNDAVIHIEAVENAYVPAEIHHSAKVFENVKGNAKVLKFKK